MKSLLLSKGLLLLITFTTVRAVQQSGKHPEFPFYECDEGPSAYSLEPTVQQTGSSTYCFVVRVSAPSDCSSFCCQKADLRKIELNVRPECKVSGALVTATVNGQPTKVRPSFGLPADGPEGSTILRINQLEGLNLTTADGAQLCITLAPNNAGEGCTSLEQLCAPPADVPPGVVCSAALFDSSLDCCPLATPRLGYLAPPPPPTLASTTPCTACTVLNLLPPPFTIEPARISEAQCGAWADVVVTDIMTQATAMGIALTGDAPAVTCSDTSIQVCGIFQSDTEAAWMQPWIEAQVALWWQVFVGTCPAYIAPYTTDVNVYSFTSTGGYCLDAAFAAGCHVPEADFPACTCATSPGATPFLVSPYLNVTSRATTNLYCFATKVANPNDPEDFCGQTQLLAKAEFFADYSLRAKLRGVFARAAGDSALRRVPSSWGPMADNTLKATPLNWNTTQADGGLLCLELDKSVALAEFCKLDVATCIVNLFDTTRRCCPVFPASV